MIKLISHLAFLIAINSLCSRLEQASAFSPSLARLSVSVSSPCLQTLSLPLSGCSRHNNMVLFSSPQDFMDDEDDKESTAAAVVKESKDDNASKVPIDLPSPILLSSSMILAIASTGSIFEITGGKGSPLSLAIAIIGIPASLFLIYAAIQKGIAETEEDDAAYQRKSNRF